MGGFVFIVLIIVIVGFVFSAHKSSQVKTAWNTAAGKLGLFYSEGGMMQNHRMSGKIQGLPVTVETFTRGSGKNSQKYTRYRVHYDRSLVLGLRITKEGFFSGVGKALGAQDIETGDASFDNSLLIKGNSPIGVKQFLTRERRDWIRHAFLEFDGVEVNDRGIKIESRGQEDSAVILVRKVRRLVDVASALSSAQKPLHESPAPAVALSGAAPPPLVNAARKESAPPPIPQPEPAVEWVTDSEYEAKAEELIPPPIPASSPAQMEEPTWQGMERITSSKPEPEVENIKSSPKKWGSPPEDSEPPSQKPEATVQTAIGDDSVLDVHVVGAALFDGTRGVSDIKREYDAKYANRMIHGRGMVRQWRTTSFDFVLGSGRYVMATLEIPRMPDGDCKHDTFKVTARLPLETPKVPIGDDLIFDGRLLKADGLMRELFVQCEAL